MKTKSITLIYKLTQTEVISPGAKEVERKEKWIDELQKTVPADYEPLLMKVTYEVFNPEVEKLRKFFHIAVLFYAIQNQDMYEGQPDSQTLKLYREEILDELLGYDIKTVNKVIHTRKSSADFKTVQAWVNFLKIVEEKLFEDAGYHFPDSKEFWALTEKYGYSQARDISIQQLQAKIRPSTV